MINTRATIYKTLIPMLNRLVKQGDKNPEGFRNVLYAIVLNDMKEWEEYIGNEPKFDKILQDFLSRCGGFDIQRFYEEMYAYKNVNTPQTNNTWRRLYDSDFYKVFDVTSNPAPIKDFLQVYSNGSWIKLEVVDKQVTIPSDITSIEKDIKVILPLGLLVESIVNTAFPMDDMINRLHDAVFNGIPCKQMSFSVPLELPILFTFKYES